MTLNDSNRTEIVEESQTKKLYHTPELTVYGNLTELTKGTGGPGPFFDVSTYISQPT